MTALNSAGLTPPSPAFPISILMIHGSNSNGNDRGRDHGGKYLPVSAHGAVAGILPVGMACRERLPGHPALHSRREALTLSMKALVGLWLEAGRKSGQV
jgi:hypothetical protein